MAFFTPLWTFGGGGEVDGHFISGMILVCLYSCWISIQSLRALDPGEGERKEGSIPPTGINVLKQSRPDKGMASQRGFYGRTQVWYCGWVVSETDDGDSCLRDGASCTKSS